MFALKLRGSYQFTCVTSTLEDTQKAVTKAYYAWRGMRPKGSESTYEDFMVNRTIVKLTVTKAETNNA